MYLPNTLSVNLSEMNCPVVGQSNSLQFRLFLHSKNFTPFQSLLYLRELIIIQRSTKKKDINFQTLNHESDSLRSVSCI